jgi:hypothetical protein
MTTRLPVGVRPGISPLTLVVFVIVALIAVLIAFVMYTGKKTREAHLAKLMTESARLKQLSDGVTKETSEIRNFLETKRDADMVKAFFNELDMKGTQPAPRNFRKIDADLDLWITRLDLVIRDLDQRVAQTTRESEAIEAGRDATRDDYAKRTQAKTAEADQLDQFLTSELAKKENLVTAYAKDKQDFINRFNKARDAWEARKKDLLNKTDQMTRTNAVARRSLQVQRPEPTIPPPSGRVLQCDWQTKKVVIDLGDKDHVFPGLDFDVYTFDKDGRWIVKGKIEVQQVLADTSLALLIESDPHSTIVAGDAVQTPFLPVPRKQKFVIAGFIPPGAVYNKGQLASLIRLNGGEVQPTVDLYTDVLILGETAPAGVTEMEKTVAGEAMTDAEKGRIEAELAREISVDVVDYREFLQGLQR